MIAGVGVKGDLSQKFWHLRVPSVLTNQEMMGLVAVGLQNKAQGMLIPDECLARSVVGDTDVENACLERARQALGYLCGHLRRLRGSQSSYMGGETFWECF